jgi:hypothetical protein
MVDANDVPWELVEALDAGVLAVEVDEAGA